MRRFMLLAGAVLCLPACTIIQKVDPVRDPSVQEVCIIESTQSRPDFLRLYTSLLEAKGYGARVVKADSPNNVCKTTSTYESHWFYGMWPYMSYVKLNVFVDGQGAGEALYDARGAFMNYGATLRSPTSILTELVSLLFPKGGASAAISP